MVFQILIIPLIIHIFSAPAADSAVAKPGCVDRCGNKTIPYPFGTTPECYQHLSFWVTCNDSDHSIPPRLFAQNSTVEILDISLHGQLRLLQLTSKSCYNSNGTRIRSNRPRLRLSKFLTINNTANKFTIVGCDSYAYISGWRLGRNYTTGCTAMCDAADEPVAGMCNGVGCCQTDIPGNASTNTIQVNSFTNHTNVWDFDRCGYGFLVEETQFRFSPDNLTNLINVDRLPIVVDWAIGNGTCEEAEMNSTSYTCLSPNSRCFKPENGYGYRCRCLDGYGGNPYLSQGCQDIDECGEGIHNCTRNEYCWNTDGNYTCSCPKGHSGDGRGQFGCTKKDDMKTAYAFIGISIGITAILFFAILFYMEHKRRSSQKMRQNFFNQNGGVFLLEKLARRERSPDMVRIFRSSELQKATNNFHSSMIVGQGGFGVVYKGVLTDNTLIAIKKSKRVDSEQTEQFINEVFVLSQINHRNVVRLLGCCLETEAPLLVYESSTMALFLLTYMTSLTCIVLIGRLV